LSAERSEREYGRGSLAQPARKSAAGRGWPAPGSAAGGRRRLSRPPLSDLPAFLLSRLSPSRLLVKSKSLAPATRARPRFRGQTLARLKGLRRSKDVTSFQPLLKWLQAAPCGATLEVRAARFTRAELFCCATRAWKCYLARPGNEAERRTAANRRFRSGGASGPIFHPYRSRVPPPPRFRHNPPDAHPRPVP
jgi:hypothetical protein